MRKTILVTGGAGYIGSHTLVELLENHFHVLVVDNFCNSSPIALERVKTLTGKDFAFYQLDIRNLNDLSMVFSKHHIDAVIHFAGLKAVGESTQVPLHYYQNNVTGTLTLLEAMKTASCHNLVFSSSATVYGDPQSVPITEGMPLSATNPYGRSKLFIEEICRDLAKSEPHWHIALLRYFNPVGAHSSGIIGEDPKGIPNNLMPYLLQVAVGRHPHINVFGSDYPTADGTGVRDYIHVVDLARGHLAALAALPRLEGAVAINLGTGKGSSVKEMIAAMSKVIGHPIQHQFVDRRPGDIACCFAEASLAKTKLGWQAEKDLEEMCRDSWNWQSHNPTGYQVNNAIE